MRQRLAIAVSSLVAATILAVGLSAAGFGPATLDAADDDQGDPASQGSAAELAEALEPEVIYVEPAPSPRTVVKVKRVHAGDGVTADRRTVRVRSVEREHEDEDEREHEDERWERRHGEREHDREDEHEREDD